MHHHFECNTTTTTSNYTLSLHDALPIYILHVDLENFNLSHVPVYIMGEEQLSMYAMYMSSLGNRPDIYIRSEEHTSELQSRFDLVCRRLLETKKEETVYENL